MESLLSASQQRLILRVHLVELSNVEANGPLPLCSLMMARGVAVWADGDASPNILLQTSANQMLLVWGKQAEDLQRSNQRDASFTTVN